MENIEHILNDPDYDVKQLQAWHGGFNPPPISWERRTKYLERNFIERMMTFIFSLEDNVPAADTANALFLADDNPEVAAKAWVPELIDDIVARNWWKKHVKSELADCEADAKPWWELYAGTDSHFLRGCVHPHTRMDETDSEFHKARENKSVDLAAAKLKQGARANKRKEQKRIDASWDVAQYWGEVPEIPEDEPEPDLIPVPDTLPVTARLPGPVDVTEPTPAQAQAQARPTKSRARPVDNPRRIKVKPRIFLREACHLDMTQVAELYNHHVHNSIHVADRQELSVDDMRARMETAKDCSFPFLVAIDKHARANSYGDINDDVNGRKNHAGRSRGAGNSRSRQHPSWEKVIGFAFADDYHSSESMYRFTAEFEVYVHPDYRRQKVGNCLMDRINYLMDVGWELRGGYKFTSGGPRFEPGGSHRIDAIIVHLPFDARDEETKAWMFGWLKKYGYEMKGHLPGVGVKMGRFVDLAIFWKKTGYGLNPATCG